jgi:hypothetical protein
MFNYHYEIIANQKQQEIEQKANHAWKFSSSMKKGLIQKIMKTFKAAPTHVKSNRRFDTCVSC